MFDYRSICLEVIDGDTLKFLLDQGLSSRQEESVRLKDVYAPERTKPGGAETTAFVKTWVDLHDVPGVRWPLYVWTEKNAKPEPDEKRSFVRYIATVYDITTQHCLNNDVRDFLAQHPEWGPGIT